MHQMPLAATLSTPIIIIIIREAPTGQMSDIQHSVSWLCEWSFCLKWLESWSVYKTNQAKARLQLRVASMDGSTPVLQKIFAHVAARCLTHISSNACWIRLRWWLRKQKYLIHIIFISIKLFSDPALPPRMGNFHSKRDQPHHDRNTPSYSSICEYSPMRWVWAAS